MQENGRHKGDSALLLALARGLSIRGAAEAAGVSETTAYRRLRDPATRQRIGELRAELLSQSLGRLADASSAATDTLKTLLEAESETVRLGAARSILELGSRLRDSVEIEERLATIEKALLGEKSS